ncbi:hypothetical protein PGIGA_G00207790 [Pangasianodon gigas]|uniref:Uncharacterized protein n=1 Tax=Pangasianodon gigas TaxID=30993 RepID=A0ACC5WGQ0_PANGG|nr:hypothetical protein [Pangasianodon gigas]
MASLYQRFTGKINTSASFPGPPEASRLLGAREKATKSPEPRPERRRGTAREDEDGGESITPPTQRAWPILASLDSRPRMAVALNEFKLVISLHPGNVL